MSHRSPRALLATAALLTAAAFTACSGGDTSESGAPSEAEDGELTQLQLEQGIGPVRDLELGPIDPTMVERGQTLYQKNCSACHRLDERLVGPRLGTVLARRSPEFVMNMILNSEEMVERHPVVQELFREFMTPMLTQIDDPEQARAILEYLRSARIDTTGAPGS